LANVWRFGQGIAIETQTEEAWLLLFCFRHSEAQQLGLTTMSLAELQIIHDENRQGQKLPPPRFSHSHFPDEKLTLAKTGSGQT